MPKPSRRASSARPRRRKAPSKAAADDGEEEEEEEEEEQKLLLPLSFPAGAAPTAPLAYYYSRCALHGRAPDAAFSIALQTSADFVVASSTTFKLSDLLPVCETLAKCDTCVARLCLNWCALGPMACVALAACLRENTSVRVLEITGNAIDDGATEALAVVIKSGTRLEQIDLHGNSITAAGARVLAGAIRDAKRRGSALQRFRMTNNYLHQEGVDLMEAAAKDTAPHGDDEHHEHHDDDEHDGSHDHHHHSPAKSQFQIGVREGNFLYEEVWNAITHGLGCASAIACLVVLSRTCSACDASARTWTATLLYGIANLTMFLCSTLYHSFHRCGPVDIFGVLDHAAIYILIAGTYTPYLVATRLWDDHFAIALGSLAVVWALAALGIALDVIGDKASVLVKRLSLSLYVLMGWLVMFISPWLFPLLTPKAISLLKWGGVVYTSGVYFFIKGNTSPKYHVVWHVFVHAASMVHFFSVLDVLGKACSEGAAPTLST
jgi:hemolysin III